MSSLLLIFLFNIISLLLASSAASSANNNPFSRTSTTSSSYVTRQQQQIQTPPCQAGTFITNSSTTTSPTGTPAPTLICQSCNPGTFQPIPNTTTITSCTPCSSGSYSSKFGRDDCMPCPFRLSSNPGSTTCPFCAEDFYLKDNSISMETIKDNPEMYCLPCPENAMCPSNTTIETLIIPPNYWRINPVDATKIYDCDKTNPDGKNKACIGSINATNNMTMMMNRTGPLWEQTGLYCRMNHTGPICLVCVNDNEYFDNDDGFCVHCPSFGRLFIPLLIYTLIVGLVIFIMIARTRYVKVQQWIREVSLASAAIGLRTKLKILLSFYQIVNALFGVYGVTIDQGLEGWFHSLKILTIFNPFALAGIPEGCFGSMITRLIAHGTKIYVVIGISSFGIYLNMAIQRKRKDNAYVDVWQTLRMRIIYSTILIIFVLLPSVTSAIFDGIRCCAFGTSEFLDLRTSYLKADPSVTCGKDSEEHVRILGVFWVFFVLWPILVPVALLALLLYVRPSVQSNRITPLAEASSFLWRDYNENFMFWEIIDLVRKMFLTGYILFIDIDGGSNRLFRLILAIVVSSLYMGYLLRAQPYKRKDDHDLALISNLLLICCFSLGIPLQLCYDDDDACERYIGFHFDFKRASVLAMAVTGTMLVITILFLIVLTKNSISAAVVRLASTGQLPNLELTSSCKYHVFISHVWSTGKDKTHSIVRKLQLYIPGLTIWLDVDQLTNIGNLEQDVSDSAVIVIFYSDDYFRSKNCRREVHAAVENQKPVIILYEGDKDVVDKMHSECLSYCTDGEVSSTDIESYLFAEDPLLWLGGSSHNFSIESIKLVSERILSHLPYFVNNPAELDSGLMVSNELGKVSFLEKVDILVYEGNNGAHEVAEEIKDFVENRNVSIHNAEQMLLTTTTDWSSFYFLIYLNEDCNLQDDTTFVNVIKKANDAGVNIVLVREQDSERGACKMSVITSNTPQDLLDKPYEIFNRMATPLYSFDRYRMISLCQVMLDMNGVVVSERIVLNSSRDAI